MVDSRFVGLLHTTDRTPPGVLFNYFCFRGYAGNKKKHRYIITILVNNLQISLNFICSHQYVSIRNFHDSDPF